MEWPFSTLIKKLLLIFVVARTSRWQKLKLSIETLQLYNVALSVYEQCCAVISAFPDVADIV